jgi:hypothetical protein
MYEKIPVPDGWHDEYAKGGADPGYPDFFRCPDVDGA